jgi:hypothetical protein
MMNLLTLNLFFITIIHIKYFLKNIFKKKLYNIILLMKYKIKNNI